MPITAFNANREIQSGEDWLNGQSDAQQKLILGGARWRAWKDGVIQIADMSALYYDDVYGAMRYAPSLKQMIGDQAARQYYAG